MRAIILAAGKGTRLAAHTNNLPKCLLKVGTQCLIDHQLQALRSAGINDVVMVLGYKAPAVKTHLERYPDMRFTLLENPDYEQTNTAYSLWIARHEMTDDFIYLNADVLLHAELIRRLANATAENALAVIRKSTGPEEVKVVLKGCRIMAIGKGIEPASAYGEFIGIGRFSKRICRLFGECLDQLVRTDGCRQDYFESAVQRMASWVPLTAVDISDLFCIEIDYPEDLAEARAGFACVPDETGGVRRPRVLFYIERNLHLPFLEPIHDYIAARYCAELAFSAPPYQPPASGRTGYGLEDHIVHRIRARSRFYSNPQDFCPDVTVVADACFYAVRHCGRVVNVGHGLISKGWFYTDSPVVRRENVADMICVPGEWHRRVLQPNVFSRIHVSGFLKSDKVLGCGEGQRSAFLCKYGIGPDKRLVLFAPTFNEELSAIPCVRERIAELADGSTVVLIKPHTMLDQKWLDLYEKLALRDKNVILIAEDDFASAMAYAHVMVSDVSSVYVEFMLLDKPAVLFNSPLQRNYQHYDAHDIEYRLRDAALQVSTVEEMKLAVQLSLADPGALSHKRNEYTKLLGCPQDGSSAHRAALAVMELVTGPERDQADGPFFSVIVDFKDAPDTCEVQKTIDEIRAASRDLRHEIIVLAPGMLPDMNYQENVTIILPGHYNGRNEAAYLLQNTSGDYLVWIEPNLALPDRWLKWMGHYFRWHQDAGAVKAFSYHDGYMDIVSRIPDHQRPQSFEDAAQYFLHVLMGNDVPLDGLSNEADCIMISRRAYHKIAEHASDLSINRGFKKIGLQLKLNHFTIWQAMEVFVYPRDARHELIAAGDYQKLQGKKARSAAANDARLHNRAEAFRNECAPGSLEHIQQTSEMARAYKPDKNHNNAIDLLETGGDETVKTDECNSMNALVSKTAALLAESKLCKQERKFEKAIALLEEARQLLG